MERASRRHLVHIWIKTDELGKIRFVHQPTGALILSSRLYEAVAMVHEEILEVQKLFMDRSWHSAYGDSSATDLIRDWAGAILGIFGLRIHQWSVRQS